MKTLLALAIAVGLSLAGSIGPAAADQGVWRQPADPWAGWGRQHQKPGGWDGRHWDRRDDDDRDGHHWNRGHWYGPPVVVHPPYRVNPIWVPGRWAWTGAYWVWVPGYWAY
jgi:hypothetical protein